jgi:transforming growth factor-beta-induced protein
VFAPTDAAFELLPPGSVATLLKPENVELLRTILTYHVVVGSVLSSELEDGQQVETVNGATLAIGVDGSTVTVNAIEVSLADVAADNGVIHVVGQVLLPPGLVLPPSIVEIATSGAYPTLVAALGAADLVATLSGEGPFTVFAPTEDAFAKLPIGALQFLLRNPDILKEILLYHVVLGSVLSSDLADGEVQTLLPDASVTVSIDGATVKIDDATVVGADNIALNGVVHVIDTVLFPAGFEAPLTLVEIATGGVFPTLVAALVAADLVDALSGANPLTVFAPNEDAFAALPTGALQFLLRNPDILTQVLLYHVVDGNVLSPTLADGQVVPTLSADGNVTVSIDGATVMINGATVVGADNIALNGVIHVIDTVLIPPGVMAMITPSILDLAIGDGNFVYLTFLIDAFDLSEVFNDGGPLSTSILWVQSKILFAFD